MVKTILKKFDRRGNPLPPARLPKHPHVSLPKSACPKEAIFPEPKVLFIPPTLEEPQPFMPQPSTAEPSGPVPAMRAQAFTSTVDIPESIETIELSSEIYQTFEPSACTVTKRKVKFSPVIRQKVFGKFGLSKQLPPFGTPDTARQEKLRQDQAKCRRVGWTQNVVQSESFGSYSAPWTNPKYGNMTLSTKELIEMLGKHQKCEQAHFRPKLVAPTAMDGSDRVVWNRSDFPQLDFETDTLVYMLEQERDSPGMFSHLVKFVEAGFTKVVKLRDIPKKDKIPAEWFHVDCHVAFDSERVERMLQQNQFDPERQATRMKMQLVCLNAAWEEGQYMELCADGQMRYIWRHPLFLEAFGVTKMYDIVTERVPWPNLTRK